MTSRLVYRINKIRRNILAFSFVCFWLKCLPEHFGYILLHWLKQANHQNEYVRRNSANHRYVETFTFRYIASLCFFSIVFQFYVVTVLCLWTRPVRKYPLDCGLENSMFLAFKYQVLPPQSWLELSQNIQWFHAYKCWNDRKRSLASCNATTFLSFRHGSQLIYM